MRPKRWSSSERERSPKRIAACEPLLPTWPKRIGAWIERSTRFLARGYQRKEIVDYAIGPQTSVSETEARQMIDTAARFVDRVAEILAEEPR
jgi:hypothetical protein